MTQLDLFPEEPFNAIDQVVQVDKQGYIRGIGIKYASLNTPPMVEAAHPTGFRYAQYPDGSKRLQGAYYWNQGAKGGTMWKDLPMVMVGEDGQELG